MQKVFIAPINDGLITNSEPWLLPNDAFETLINAYPYRGRLKKRPGTEVFNTDVAAAVKHLHTRLRVEIGTTDPGTGNFVGNAPGNIFKNGQAFSVEGPNNNTVFTVFQNGATYTTGTATATYNTGTGAITITGNGENPSTPVFFYPAEPVMGIVTYDRSSVNREQYFAFDTQFSYEYNGNAWERFNAPTAWQGNDTNFFWATNWRGVDQDDFYLFVVNYNAADSIKFWDNTTWRSMSPQVNAAGDTLQTSRIITVFKDRLVCLNTIENTGTFTNRCRFSQNGIPNTVGPGSDTTAWREDIVGKGGYIDAPTREAITTAEFLKDRLIVYFERSTWELVYTGNQILPFIWQKINTELGCESTFSVIPFDKQVLGVGNVGIHSCNGANVERIDEKIKDTVFEIHNNNEGPLRVAGIRDYTVDLVYWALPDVLVDRTYPNRILLYNYLQQAWAFLEESITAFGYFQKQETRTWATLPYETWAVWNDPWNFGRSQAQFLDVIAGNQQGFMFYINPDNSYNDLTMQVTDVTVVDAGNALITSYNHNFETGQYVLLENMNGLNNFSGRVFQVQNQLGFAENTFTVQTNANTDPFSGVYEGSGTITRVSNLHIITKRFNFYTERDTNTALQRVDFLVTKTGTVNGGGQVLVSYGSSFSFPFLPRFQSIPESVLGTSVLETFPYDPAIFPHEQIQDKFWHPIDTNIDGSTFQLRISMTDEQMRDRSISESEFELHGMVLYVTPTSARLQ